MTIIVGKSILPELKQFGVEKMTELCYNCGKCTSVCSLTEDGSLFPRRVIRYLQLGARDRLKEDPSPWNCYYCGDCSTSCPRGAEPAEIMMGVRRWLTAEYDTTGMSRRLYINMKAVWIAVAFWAILPLIMFGLMHTVAKSWIERTWDVEIAVVTENVQLNKFAPVEFIETIAHAFFIYLVIILAQGSFNMIRHIRNDQYIKKAGFIDYIKEGFARIWEIASIKKWRECDNDERMRKWKHWIIVLSYLSMFIIITLFLDWFQVDKIYGIENPQRWVGYLLTIGLLYGSLEPMIGRIRKKEQIHKHSHHTDWMFLILIFLVTLTGILVHIFRYADMPMATYISYALHLSVDAVFLGTQLGIGKWTHIFYRPIGGYFEGLKNRMIRKENISKAT